MSFLLGSPGEADDEAAKKYRKACWIFLARCVSSQEIETLSPSRKKVCKKVV